MLKTIKKVIFFFLPLWLKKVIQRYLHYVIFRHAFFFLRKKVGIKKAFSQLFFQHYTSKRAHLNRLKKLENIRAKKTITVVFQTWNLSKYKYECLYKAMAKHPRFNPIVWMCDEPGSIPHERKQIREQLIEYFEKNSIAYVEAETWESLKLSCHPDMLFIQDPYFYELNMPPHTDNELLCYIRYYVCLTDLAFGSDFFLHNMVLFNFQENESIAKETAKWMSNKGRNLIVSGHPIFDEFKANSNDIDVWKTIDAKKKKIIWAPHWSISHSGFYKTSNFLVLSDIMLELAHKYKDKVHFAFKPHPTLYRSLCNHPEWGEEKANDYYKQWTLLSNTQLETGAYRELFFQSDAMIHDCGSFLCEYLATNKPCMYLMTERKDIQWNDMGKAALKCYTIGIERRDIEHFIESEVLGENDLNRRKRELLALRQKSRVNDGEVSCLSLSLR